MNWCCSTGIRKVVRSVPSLSRCLKLLLQEFSRHCAQAISSDYFLKRKQVIPLILLSIFVWFSLSYPGKPEWASTPQNVAAVWSPAGAGMGQWPGLSYSFHPIDWKVKCFDHMERNRQNRRRKVREVKIQPICVTTTMLVSAGRICWKQCSFQPCWLWITMLKKDLFLSPLLKSGLTWLKALTLFSSFENFWARMAAAFSGLGY